MKPDRLTGAALIAGSVGFIVTMALHPTGGGHEKIIREASMTIGVHALAIFSVGVQMFGFLRLSRTMRPDRPYADAGLVAFAIAAVSASLAAMVSGILGPALAVRSVDADPTELAVWRVVFTYNFRLNAALTQVFIAAAIPAGTRNYDVSGSIHCNGPAVVITAHTCSIIIGDISGPPETCYQNTGRIILPDDHVMITAGITTVARDQDIL